MNMMNIFQLSHDQKVTWFCYNIQNVKPIKYMGVIIKSNQIKYSLLILITEVISDTTFQ